MAFFLRLPGKAPSPGPQDPKAGWAPRETGNWTGSLIRALAPPGSDWKEAWFADEQTGDGTPIALQTEARSSERPRGSWLLPPPSSQHLCSGHCGPLFLLGIKPFLPLQTPAVLFSLPSQVPLICQLQTLIVTSPVCSLPPHPRPDQGLRPHTLQCFPRASQGCDAPFTWAIAAVMPSSPRDLVCLTVPGIQ